MSAPLLHWLLVVCGLTGVTVLRFDDPKHVVSLWIGTVAGTALGHFAGFLRLRVWFMVVLGFALLWLAPLLLMIGEPMWRMLDTKTLFFASLPAFVCAFASLSERGGLLAFWFPTVLWMIVVLDGPSRTFDARAALPFVVGLGALFVASLHARESRRVAIWKRHGAVRLATPRETNVLRVSPLRAAVGVAWTGVVAVGALVIAAWIAPHLWKKEADHRARQAEAKQAVAEAPVGECCHTAEPKRERVSEYLALRGHEIDERPPCGPCRDTWQEPPAPTEEASGGGLASSSTQWSGFSHGTSSGGSAPPTSTVATVTPPVAAAPPASSSAPAREPEKKTSSTKTPEVDTVTVPSPTHAKMSPHAPNKSVLILVPAGPARETDTGTPWRAALLLGIGVFAAQLMLRMVRRELTVRHLERPFWRESIDQRISNHWQRMLIGLRDAGIRPAEGEQPMAFARRVGIEGMTTCAEILERVRHGVRVEAGDLDAMDGAATAVYTHARASAGVASRAVGWVRSPLA